MISALEDSGTGHALSSEFTFIIDSFSIAIPNRSTVSCVGVINFWALVGFGDQSSLLVIDIA